MEIIMQTIRIIDYENNKVVNRDIPDAFSDYVRQLIAYVDSNTSIRGVNAPKQGVVTQFPF